MLRYMINDDLIQENQVKGAFYSTMGLTSKGSSLRFKLMNKYPKYIDLTLAFTQSDNSGDKSYKDFLIDYPVIQQDPVKKKVNKAKVNKSTKVIMKKIAFEEKNVFASTKNNNIDNELDELDELDELIASSSSKSSNIVKKRLCVESDSE